MLRLLGPYPLSTLWCALIVGLANVETIKRHRAWTRPNAFVECISWNNKFVKGKTELSIDMQLPATYDMCAFDLLLFNLCKWTWIALFPSTDSACKSIPRCPPSATDTSPGVKLLDRKLWKGQFMSRWESDDGAIGSYSWEISKLAPRWASSRSYLSFLRGVVL